MPPGQRLPPTESEREVATPHVIECDGTGRSLECHLWVVKAWSSLIQFRAARSGPACRTQPVTKGSSVGGSTGVIPCGGPMRRSRPLHAVVGRVVNGPWQRGKTHGSKI